MEATKVDAAKMDYMRYKVSFVYKQCSMAPYCMASWLKLDEFVSMVWDEVQRGTIITNEVILSIIAPLYQKISENRDDYPDFEIQTARRGMHQLQRACSSPNQ